VGSILFVEDEPELRVMIGAALQDLGFDVTLAEHAKGAMALLARNSFQTVISDVSMPGGMSGIELAEHVGQAYPDTRVILVSGHALAQLPRLPSNVRFLPKPYRFPQLVSLLDAGAA
jgi:two-component system cell cycle response regulator CpdR